MKNIAFLLIACVVVGTVENTQESSPSCTVSAAYPALARKVGGQKTRLQYQQQQRKFRQQKTARSIA